MGPPLAAARLVQLVQLDLALLSKITITPDPPLLLLHLLRRVLPPRRPLRRGSNKSSCHNNINNNNNNNTLAIPAAPVATAAANFSRTSLSILTISRNPLPSPAVTEEVRPTKVVMKIMVTNKERSNRSRKRKKRWSRVDRCGVPARRYRVGALLSSSR